MTLWSPIDPGRPCFTCGRKPDYSFADGSPAYTCHHDPIVVREPYPWPDIRIDVTLTDAQMERGRAHAVKVIDRARERGLHHTSPTGNRPGRPPELERTVVGFLGEIAAADLTGLPWRPAYWTGRKLADIGARVEVRSTRTLNYPLHLYPRDRRSFVFLLMQTWRPDFRRWRAIGWMEGADLVDPRYVVDEDDGRPVYAAPRIALHPLPLPPDS